MLHFTYFVVTLTFPRCKVQESNLNFPLIHTIYVTFTVLLIFLELKYIYAISLE